MAAIEIRPMKHGDIGDVYRLECICFRSPWSKASLLGELHNRVAHYFVILADDVLAGYGGMWVLYEEAHVTNIGVHPDYRRKGFAKQLLQRMMEHALSLGAEAMTLEVRESNIGAQALYAQMGFEQNGYRPRYYDDTGEAALLLWNKNLESTVASFGKMC